MNRAIINVKNCEVCPCCQVSHSDDNETDVYCRPQRCWIQIENELLEESDQIHSDFDWTQEVAPWCPYLVKHVLDGGK